MKITILVNQVESLAFGRPEDILAEEDSLETAEAIEEALSLAGHDTELFVVDERSIGELYNYQTDFFFNQAFGINSLPKTEAKVAEELEKTNTPFSGSGSEAITLTTDKIATKKLTRMAGLPTPNFWVSGPKIVGEEVFDLKFPVIVKPGAEDCSLGIDGTAVVTGRRELESKVNQLSNEYHDPVLVEEYIDGRELNVTVLGNGKTAEVLPISEIIFGPSYVNKYKVLDFAAKWEEQSVEYLDTTEHRIPPRLSPKTRREVERVAKEVYLITGCTDYARVDIRLSEENIPYILEVNANPGIGPTDGALRSAAVAGYSYKSFLMKIIEVAMKRYGQREKYDRLVSAKKNRGVFVTG